MAVNILQKLFFLTIITFASQKQLGGNLQKGDLLQGVGLQTLLQNLQRHSGDHEKFHRLHGRAHPNLLNVQTLNLYVNPNTLEKALGKLNNQFLGERAKDSRNDLQPHLLDLENELSKLTDPEDPLRCSQRCGRDVRTGDLRCGCRGRPRSGDREEYLRCGCRGRPRSGDREEEEEDDSEEDGSKHLRCSNNRCGRFERTANRDLNSELERYGKKYKLNDDLDAIVLDFENFNDLLEKFKHDKKNGGKNFDADYYGGENYRQNNKGRPLQNYVLNVKDEDLLDPVSPNELAEYYEDRKSRILNNALNFVTNKRGSKDVSYLSHEQVFQLQKLRAQVQRRGTDSFEIEQKVKKVILGKNLNSEVLPHEEGSNNVYVPDWLHKAVKQSRDELRSKKQLFPLTHKQKLKQKKAKKPVFVRRNVDEAAQEYGVPFELEVEGLGQLT